MSNRQEFGFVENVPPVCFMQMGRENDNDGRYLTTIKTIRYVAENDNDVTMIMMVGSYHKK